MRPFEISSTRSSVLAVIVGTALVIAVGIVDVITGYEINLGLFYLAPIAIFTWFTRLAAGYIISLVAVAGMFIVDNFVTRHIPFPSHDLIPYWNSLIRLGYFLVFAWIVDALRKSHDRERRYARYDFLTNVLNSQGFSERTRHEIDRARRYNHPLSVAFMDCDNFKQINDRFGHQVGDKLLRIVADIVAQRIRNYDIVARLGGDEFGIVLPETGPEAAKDVIEKLRGSLLQEMSGRGWPVTFSIGVVTFQSPPDTVDEAIRASDQLMYDVKTGGKNSCRYRIFDRTGGLVDASH